MHKSIIVAVGLAIAAMAVGCGHPAPTTADERPQASITWHTARPEDEQLLDEMKLGWLNAAQASYDAGKTDLSLMHIQLQRIEEARQSLRALEEERSRFLAAGEVQYLSGYCDPFALNHALQMIENARQNILAGVTEGTW